MESVWKKEVPPFAHGQEGALPRRTEVAIVGGGLVGVLTALYLKENGIDSVVLEAGEAPGVGQSGRTTGKITCQHGLKYAALIRDKGESAARTWASACQGAIHAYEGIVGRLGLSCDLELLPALLYTQKNDGALEREASAARRCGIAAELRRRTDLPFDVSLALSYPRQAQLQPYKFLLGVASRVRVFCGVRVTAIKGRHLLTEEGDEIEAQRVVLACHYPIGLLPSTAFTRLWQSTSYVLALGGVKPLAGMYYGIDRDGLSLRSHGSTLLLTGMSHRTGEEHPPAFEALEGRAREYFPEGHVVTRWAAQDCMSEDGLPLVGPASPLTPHHYIATGFSKWGMTGAMLAAQMIAGDIVGAPHFAAPLCSPARFTLSRLRATARQVGETARGWGRRLFEVPAELSHELAPGEGEIALSGGIKVAHSRDEQGEEHILRPYCTHMGCQLNYNPDTLSWDCPCHGSRFSEEGKVLDAPATKPLSKKPTAQGDTP